jgi:hypothetical protein
MDFPGNVGELQHGYGHVADGHGRVKSLALAHGGNEVAEVQIGHGIGSHRIS